MGTVPYEAASRLQEELASRRARRQIGDVLLLLEHLPVITLGRGGGQEDILAPPSRLQREGIHIVPTDRGGRATYHGPGQLVAYPILRLNATGLHEYVERLEEVAIAVVGSYGLPAGRLEGYPGVWVGDRKVAAVGVCMRDGVSRHGLALNVAPDLSHFQLLVPCGIAGRGVTSLQRELGSAPGGHEVAWRFRQAFADVFSVPVVEGRPEELAEPGEGPPGQVPAGPPGEPPAWLWSRSPAEGERAVGRMEGMLSELRLHTVCHEAECPNLAECFAQGTATFLLLGRACTRGCRFCAVTPGQPAPPDPGEPERVAEAARRLGLSYVVLTSVTRDDLPDGGASWFARTVRAVRSRVPHAKVEVLIPDFQGSCAALETVLAAEPDVLNHNLETVPRLYPQVRPGADYGRSLRLLARVRAQAPGVLTKSGLMLGLGEGVTEVLRVLADLRRAGCDLLTLGQYLRPGERHLPVTRYVPPDEFAGYGLRAQEMGFRGVASAPLVRSSHKAGLLWRQATGGR